MMRDVELFIDDIRTIDDFDYGDYMRRANLYLNHLRENLNPTSQDVKNKLNEMQNYLQYCLLYMSNLDIEIVRDKIINDALYVDDLMKGHNQDWESAAPIIE